MIVLKRPTTESETYGTDTRLRLFAAKIAISLALLYVAIGFVDFAALRNRIDRIDYAWIAAA